ncbi:MAG TPA: 3-phosphoshikimate 1-carboxyvinyltransferase [Candidatus Ornithomonoglobus merdipullorum]|uniref:3-phosphoshikimate 1-carboxyvinyltransferase n=1 Tax=Candidatus Ornithomonoglobus merdipullorum TaxID=2840895 RepID=A0A9D1MDU0_9FIRM|nr:3-phosphoshikimate 1-carboxyvinyltransferase [Candidatus Ornithomonoglobus merdipullorum]
MLIHKMKRVQGEITVPGDKSISHRAVMLGALADGITHINGFLRGADCLSTIDCFRKMGVRIDDNGDSLTVHGNGLHGLRAPKVTLYTGNSGTTTRLLCGILAGQPFDAEITGDASICKRPMGRVTKPLSLMGADIENEYCPLIIHGTKLHGIDYSMTVASAQVKTAIILAGLYAEGETVIHEIEKSRDHTELMLGAMGADIAVDGLTVRVGKTDRLAPQDVTVPGDISSAAFFIVLGAIMPDSEITIKNVGINPTRTGIIDVMKAMGADISVFNERTEGGEPTADMAVRTSSLHGTEIGGALIPRLIDELPVIAAAAVFANGKTVIRDAQELKIKETNRIRAVVDEFKKAGVDITETDDGMIINGGRTIHGAEFSTYGDHRMAMSLAILAQLAEGGSTLDDASCVDVSYPGFFDDFYGLEK